MTLLCLKTPAYMVMGCGYIICDVHNNQFSNHTACRLNDGNGKTTSNMCSLAKRFIGSHQPIELTKKQNTDIGPKSVLHLGNDSNYIM